MKDKLNIQGSKSSAQFLDVAILEKTWNEIDSTIYVLRFSSQNCVMYVFKF